MPILSSVLLVPMLHEDKGEVSTRQNNASMAANKLLSRHCLSVWVRVWGRARSKAKINANKDNSRVIRFSARCPRFAPIAQKTHLIMCHSFCCCWYCCLCCCCCWCYRYPHSMNRALKWRLTVRLVSLPGLFSQFTVGKIGLFAQWKALQQLDKLN